MTPLTPGGGKKQQASNSDQTKNGTPAIDASSDRYAALKDLDEEFKSQSKFLFEINCHENWISFPDLLFWFGGVEVST